MFLVYTRIFFMDYFDPLQYPRFCFSGFRTGFCFWAFLICLKIYLCSQVDLTIHTHTVNLEQIEIIIAFLQICLFPVIFLIKHQIRIPFFIFPFIMIFFLFNHFFTILFYFFQVQTMSEILNLSVQHKNKQIHKRQHDCVNS